MCVVLSANTNTFGDYLIFKIGRFILVWKSSWTFLNFNSLIISSKSFSKYFLLVICAGCRLELNLKVSLAVSLLSVSFKKKKAFHLIPGAATQTCSQEKVFWKYAANLQEITHVEVWFQWSWNHTSSWNHTFYQNTFSWEHLWMAASVIRLITLSILSISFNW